MNKSRILFSLASSLFILTIVEAVSGFVLWFIIPRGGGRRGLEEAFWNLTRTDWLTIHDWAAVAFLIILIVHTVLHWKWIARMIRSGLGSITAKSLSANTKTS